jgi:branched-chain amino acid transport system permease protein
VDQLIQLCANGLALGCVYGLVALGFILVSEATGVVNFATGQFVMLGCFMGVSTVMKLGLPIWPGYGLALVGMLAFGAAFYFLVYRPLQDGAAVSVIIGTVGIGIAMQNVALLVWDSLPLRPPSPFHAEPLAFGRSVLSWHWLFAIAVTGVLVSLLYVVLYRSALGARMRAVAQDREAARLMGIPVDALLMLTWLIAAFLAGVAGLLLGPLWFADVSMGDPIALKAFAAAIIGGFGSVHGAILGGVFVGLAEILGAAYLTSTYKDALVFLLMVLFLLVRPQGIFGERISQRG